MIADWNAWAQRVGVPTDRLLGIPSINGPVELGVDLLLDTFNRNDLVDIDAATNGISGSLLSVAENNLYYEGYEGSGTPDSIYVVNGALQMAVGGGMAENGLMHNFVDESILSYGGFSIEMDVLDIRGGTDDISNRYVGFGVGLTESEASAGSDISGNLSFRGSTSSPNGLADFFAEVDMDGNVKVWSKGQLLETVSVGSVTGQLLVAFELDGFETNSSVEASVYFDGQLLDINTPDSNRMTRSFSWENAGQNYIGLSARSTDCAIVDNLAVRSFPLGNILVRNALLSQGFSPEDAVPEADPDGDGFSNYLEWLTGGDLLVANESIRDLALISIPSGGDPVRIQVHRISETLAGGEMIDSVLVSQDLKTWMPVTASEVSRTPDPDQEGYEYLELELSEDVQQYNRLFMAIRYK